MKTSACLSAGMAVKDLRERLIVRNAIQRGTLVLFALVVTLGGIEIALRILRYNPMAEFRGKKNTIVKISSASHLQYELSPNTSGQAWETSVSINSKGFRDYEYPAARNTKYRILVFGDSITFGNYLPSVEDTYPKQAEDLLNKNDSKFEVLNFGVPGYDVVNYVGLLQYRGLKFKPDMVIVGLCINDIGIMSPTRSYVKSLDRLNRPLYKIRLAQMILRFAQNERGKRWQIQVNSEKDFRELYNHCILPVDNDAVLMNLMKELAILSDSGGGTQGMLKWYSSKSHVGFLEYALDQLLRLSKDLGFVVAIMPIPYLSPQHKAESHAINKIVSHEIRKFGFDQIHLEEEFNKVGLEKLGVKGHGNIHPNRLGHSLIAKKIADYVMTLK